MSETLDGILTVCDSGASTFATSAESDFAKGTLVRTKGDTQKFQGIAGGLKIQGRGQHRFEVLDHHGHKQVIAGEGIKALMTSEDEMMAHGTVDSGIARQRNMTLETLVHKLCAHGEGIRLEFLEDNAGSLRVTLKQIKTAIRAAMKGVNRECFAMTFKRGQIHHSAQGK